MKTRSEIAHEEATRDPIFLLQERVVRPNQDCPAEYGDDPETECYTDDELIEMGWGGTTWRTISVFLTREEGEEFAKQTSYRYGRGRKNIDWMVYCIPCDGELASILKEGE